MCMVCVDFLRGKITREEARNVFREVSEIFDEEHIPEAVIELEENEEF